MPDLLRVAALGVAVVLAWLAVLLLRAARLLSAFAVPGSTMNDFGTANRIYCRARVGIGYVQEPDIGIRNAVRMARGE